MVSQADEPKGCVLNLRPGRSSNVKIPFDPACIVTDVINGVKVHRLAVKITVELVAGREVVRLLLPDGSKVENEKRTS